MKRPKRYINPAVEEEEQRKKDIELVVREILQKEGVLSNIAQLLIDVAQLKLKFVRNG